MDLKPAKQSSCPRIYSINKSNPGIKWTPRHSDEYEALYQPYHGKRDNFYLSFLINFLKQRPFSPLFTSLCHLSPTTKEVALRAWSARALERLWQGTQGANLATKSAWKSLKCRFHSREMRNGCMRTEPAFCCFVAFLTWLQPYGERKKHERYWMFRSWVLVGHWAGNAAVGNARAWEDVHVCGVANRSQTLLHKARRELWNAWETATAIYSSCRFQWVTKDLFLQMA